MSATRNLSLCAASPTRPECEHYPDSRHVTYPSLLPSYSPATLSCLNVVATRMHCDFCGSRAKSGGLAEGRRFSSTQDRNAEGASIGGCHRVTVPYFGLSLS